MRKQRARATAASTDPVKRSQIASPVEKPRKTGRARRSSPATVDIRELKASLSSYVARVKSGQTLTLTEHGTPVARLIPLGVPAGLEALVAQRLVSWPADRVEFPEPRIRLRGRKTATDFVIGDRA